MKKFMDKDFLLNSKTAQDLYDRFAQTSPIIDYHCHLNPKEIYEDRKFRNITEIWLGGDHYKWRAMRSNGVVENDITGSTDDRTKFQRWAETVPFLIGNPLYHWTHLELRRYFGIEDILSPATADSIWERANKVLETKTARTFIKESNVKVICTTDDPIDTLEWHIKLKEDTSFDVKVLPTFRPDKAINIELSWFRDWIADLEKVSNKKIFDLDSLLDVLVDRIDFFHEVGCRLSDHALDVVTFKEATKEEVNAILVRGLKGETLTATEVEQYKTYMVQFFGREYAKRDWAMQLHIGALRNNSKRMLRNLGPDTGFDAINDRLIAEELAKLLDSLDDTNELPRTILYNLNPRENEVLAVLMGCFQGGGIAGKIQFGSGWWFLDQQDGMKRQMEALAQLGVFSAFVGMLTDSRSFLSYTRHEYFRRILCDKIAEYVESGQYPADIEFVGQVVENICYHNAKKYFKF